jgi:hypothetical protein
MEVVMNKFVILSLAGFLLLSCGFAGARPGSKKDREVEWARNLAADFFAAVLTDHGPGMAGVLDPELAKVLLEKRKTWPAENAYTMDSILDDIRFKYKTAQIVTTMAAPNGSEFIFSGTLRSRFPGEFDNKYPDGDFVMRVARQSPGRAWTIRALRVTPRADTPKTTEK